MMNVSPIRLATGTDTGVLFDQNDLIRCATGDLFGPGYARLPAPPMLMLNQVSIVDEEGGKFGSGYSEGSVLIDTKQWYFESHFVGCPVMPGSLISEAMWQLGGFFGAHSGFKGGCRVIAGGDTQFRNAVLPTKEQTELHIKIHVRKVKKIKQDTYTIADAYADHLDQHICRCSGMKIGFFADFFA